MYLAEKFFSGYLDPGEKILAVCHRHPVVFLPDFLRILFFGYIIPLFLFYLFPDYLIFFGLWMVISSYRMLRVVTVWYHDSLLLTDISVIDVVWLGFFKRTTSRLEYSMIEGVTLEVLGFHKVVLNYGDVKVQGAGGGTYINLRDAINPRKVEKLVMKYQEKFVTDQTFKDSESLKSLLTSLVRQHIATEDLQKIKNQ